MIGNHTLTCLDCGGQSSHIADMEDEGKGAVFLIRPGQKNGARGGKLKFRNRIGCKYCNSNRLKLENYYKIFEI